MRRARSEPALPSQGSPDPVVGDKHRPYGRPYGRRRGGSCTLPEKRREYGFAEGHRNVAWPGQNRYSGCSVRPRLYRGCAKQSAL